MFTDADRRFMARALELAERALYTSAPNPRVGSVMVRGDQIIGEGWNERAGGPHAEVVALRAAGERARGATAYVTLEPCSHFGRTPPCADALEKAGIARVVASMIDPNPLVAGKGLERLRAAGIRVDSGLMEREARELNVGFVSRMTRGRPWVRVKIAASIDGRTALRDGRSQWITDARARADGHRWRARSCAVMTGIGTVRTDDPQLTVRDVDTPRQPLRIIVDGKLDTPPSARVVGSGTLIVNAIDNSQRAEALRARGAELLSVPSASGRVDLNALMKELARRELNEIHVEAGPTLNGALMTNGLVDELLLYFAPKVLGSSARGMFDVPELSDIPAESTLEFRDVHELGECIRVVARVRR